MPQMNKVVWSEGLFLRPHHFQQQERYLEALLERRLRASLAYGWGFEQLVIDTAALAMGKLQLASASGVLPDGTPFAFPGADAAPLALDVQAGAQDTLVYLAVALARPGMPSVWLDSPSQAPALMRYVAADAELGDSVAGFGEAATIQVGQLVLRLVAAEARSGALAAMPVARVSERRSDGQVVLDPGHVPPMLSAGASPVLESCLRELIGKLRQRIEAAAAVIEQASGRGGVSEIAEFLMLQAHSRHGALLEHLARVPRLHPERLYAALLQLAGDLSVFAPERRLGSPGLEAYAHDDLQATFQPLMARLRYLLSLGMERSAVQVPLHERRFGVRVAIVQDRELLRGASFVLAANAQLPAEMLRQRLPKQIKIGPVERLKDLVNLALPGIELRALPVVPRQIPFHAGYSYFELERGGELWTMLEQSGSLGLHLTGDFAGLELELWAIRG